MPRRPAVSAGVGEPAAVSRCRGHVGVTAVPISIVLDRPRRTAIAVRIGHQGASQYEGEAGGPGLGTLLDALVEQGAAGDEAHR